MWMMMSDRKKKSKRRKANQLFFSCSFLPFGERGFSTLMSRRESKVKKD